MEFTIKLNPTSKKKGIDTVTVVLLLGFSGVTCTRRYVTIEIQNVLISFKDERWKDRKRFESSVLWGYNKKQDSLFLCITEQNCCNTSNNLFPSLSICSFDMQNCFNLTINNLKTFYFVSMIYMIVCPNCHNSHKW